MEPPVKLAPGDVDGLENLLREHRIFERYGLERIGVYGSFARGEAYNDIDLLVDVDSRNLPKWRLLRDELEVLVQLNIDLVLSEFMDPIVHYRAKKDLRYVTASKK